MQEKVVISIIPRNHPIIPEYSPILLYYLSTGYYSQNYAGIIDACVLVTSHSSEEWALKIW